MPRHEVELLRAARAVARLQREARELRRKLKAVQSELRVERKHLKALAALGQAPAPDVAPSRIFGDGVGVGRAGLRPRRAPVAANGTDDAHARELLSEPVDD